MIETTNGVQVCLVGYDPERDEMEEAWLNLAGVPRIGDEISIWTGDSEAYVKVEAVTWPAFEYEHDPGVQAPKILIARDPNMTDAQWRDVFQAVADQRHP